MTTLIIVIALIIGFYVAWNIGANDVSNAMGTSVGSGALTLRRAIIIAAVLEFSGAFFFGSHVSSTIQKGLVNQDIFSASTEIQMIGMLSSLIAAGVWMQLASYFGWPVSTTHSIVGAIVGFAAFAGGLNAVYWSKVRDIAFTWIFSPMCGAIASFITFNLLKRQIFYRADPIRAAKQLAPFLSLFVFSALTFVLTAKGLKNLPVAVPKGAGAILSIGVGLIAGMVSKLLVKRIPESPKSGAGERIDPHVSTAIEKSRRHLRRVQAAVSGEMQFQVADLLKNVDQVANSIRDRVSRQFVHAEYAAVESMFRYMQICTAMMMAFAHGANDVANAIGPLSAVIDLAYDRPIGAIPTWLLAVGGFGIVIGLATWGWRVIETVGKKITELTPSRGFAAEFGASLTILVASSFGMPVSTTHILVGSVLGVGLARGIGTLNIRTIREIFISWIVTVPAGGFLSIFFFVILKWLLPLTID